MLRRLEARGEWGAWRTLASLALLYHHGGVLVPPARYRPLRSLDCFPSFATDQGQGQGQGQGGLQRDLHRVHSGLVEEVGRRDAEEAAEAAAAWGPDLGVMAAPRHDEGLRRAVELLFFSFSQGADEEALGEGGWGSVLDVLREEGGIA